jgi:lipoic acid synthetase
MKALMEGLSLHTVCESAHCPNQGECFSRGTATFLILGDVCTRNCRFCAIKKGRPSPLDPNEPLNVAEAVNKLGLKHAVVTSVTRDDLPDGGAGQFVNTIDAIRQINPQVTIEVLIPDFQGSYEALKAVVASSPEVINHNVDTIPRLFPEVRPKKSDYLRSIKLLQMVKAIDSKMVTKSGLMLGLGETHDEVVAVMEALRAVECDCLTISQYLPPSPAHYPLDRYITPEEFEQYRKRGEEMGFSFVASGPFVRSSYRAAEAYSKVMHRQGI